MSYVFVGPHPDTLAGGTPLGLNQEVAAKLVDPSDPHDQRLIDEGWLIKQDKPAASTSRTPTPDPEA